MPIDNKESASAKPGNPSVPEVNPEQFAEFLLELLHSERLLGEFNKWRHEPTSCDLQGSRMALGEVFLQLFRQPFNDALRPALDAVIKLRSQVSLLQKEMEEANTRLQYAVSDRVEMSEFLREGEAKRRYLTECYAEKRLIAKHLVDRYFDRQVHCFFQASTTAFHLIEELQDQVQSRGSVIHTNSFALPYFVLNHMNRHGFSVYPVSGQIKDLKCCGWLYSLSDTDADTYFRSIFGRGNAPAQVAFITPQFMDCAGNFYFAKEETLNLVHSAFDCARKIIILTPGPRVLPHAGALPSASDVTWHGMSPPANMAAQAVDWVVGGELKQLDAEQRRTFEEACRRHRPGDIAHLPLPVAA